jgi:carbonic anhydrase
MNRLALVALAIAAAAGCSKLDKLDKIDKLEKLDKLDALEKQLGTLNAEVKALRTGKPPPAPKDDKSDQDEDEKGEKKDEPDEEKDEKAVAEHDEKKDEHDEKKDEHDEPKADHAARPAVAEHAPAPAVIPAAHAAPALAPAAHPAGHPPHWDYKAADSWAALSPEFAACGTGKQQSPIDLQPVRAEASDIVFQYAPTPGVIKDNGHTYQVDLEPGSSIVIDGERYNLLQFHVHAPSEHKVAGEEYAMEVHLVHKSAAGGLAVVGVLVDRGAANPGLATAWKKLPRPDRSEKLKKPFNPLSLLPEDRSLYRYAGSLTTPPCSEGVVWNVLRHSVSHDSREIDVVRARFGATARPVQEMFERKLL